MNTFEIDDRARSERRKFLQLSILVEGGISLVALGAGAIFGLPFWTGMQLSFESIGLGIVATIPLLIMLRLVYCSQSRGLVRLRQLVQELLGRSIARCGWLDLCVVALLAGVCEECLFRGLLEPLLGYWNPIVGFVGANFIFGLLHAVTPTYFVYSALTGCYLSLTLRITTEPNLIIPITVHALYDLVAFVVIRNEFLEQESKKSQGAEFQSDSREESRELPKVLDP